MRVHVVFRAVFVCALPQVHDVVAEIRAGVVTPELCCAVVDNVRGPRPSEVVCCLAVRTPHFALRCLVQVESLRELRDISLKTDLHVVCCAVIHDDMFRQVRVWARQGFTAQQIQQELDERFETVMSFRDAAAAQRRRLERNKQRYGVWSGFVAP